MYIEESDDGIEINIMNFQIPVFKIDSCESIEQVDELVRNFNGYFGWYS